MSASGVRFFPQIIMYVFMGGFGGFAVLELHLNQKQATRPTQLSGIPYTAHGAQIPLPPLLIFDVCLFFYVYACFRLF